MLKIKTRFISAVVVFAVAFTAVFGTALTAAAADIPEVKSTGGGVTTTMQRIFLRWSTDDKGTPAGLKFAVYYTYRDNTTGVFGKWTTLVEDQKDTFMNKNDYGTIIKDSIVTNATYYITILPFVDEPSVDVPSRQYGKFTPYAVFTSQEGMMEL